MQDFHVVETPDERCYLCLVWANTRPTKDASRHSARPLHRLKATRAHDDRTRHDDTIGSVNDTSDRLEEMNEARIQDEAQSQSAWRGLDVSLNHTSNLDQPSSHPRTLLEELIWLDGAVPSLQNNADPTGQALAMDNLINQELTNVEGGSTDPNGESHHPDCDEAPPITPQIPRGQLWT